MESMVRCVQCQVWIPEQESRQMNRLAELLWTNQFPEDWRACTDLHNCLRRQKDLVAVAVPYERHHSVEL